MQSKIANIFKRHYYQIYNFRSGKSQDDYDVQQQPDAKQSHRRYFDELIFRMIMFTTDETPRNNNIRSSMHHESKGNANKSNRRDKKLKKDNIYTLRMQFEAKHKRARSEVALISNNKARILSIKQNNESNGQNEHIKSIL